MGKFLGTVGLEYEGVRVRVRVGVRARVRVRVRIAEIRSRSYEDHYTNVKT